jgi:L,D-transpeptidase YcbB
MEARTAPRRMLLRLVLVAGLAAPALSAPAQPGQGLDAPGRSALDRILDAGQHPDLRWPDFTPYRDEVKDFYARGGSTLGWIRDRRPTPQAMAMIGLFQQSERKGLSPEDYDGPLWPGRLQRLASATDAELASFDAAVTVSAVRYLRALHVGRVNPKALGLKLEVRDVKHELGSFLRERIVPSGDVPAVVQSVEPAFPGYLRTLGAMDRYRAMARTDSGRQMTVPAKPVPPGGTYPDLSRMAELLRLVGDLPDTAPVDATATVYQGPVVDAVKRFQERHGEIPDGIIKAELVREMNVPMERRVRQMELTLERWRWLERSFPQPPVIVNLPAFKLTAFGDDDRLALRKNVIIGRSYGHKTPVFEKEIKYVVFRPYWEVTPTIQKGEIVPHVEKDRGYLARKGFEVVTPDGRLVTDGSVSDEVLAQLRSGKLRVRQKPGPGNSLGLVKLIFPNEDSVYLHGTEAPRLFEREERALSHGCIRVQEPADLAAWALRHNPGWTLERVKAAMNGTQNNVTVNLARPMPVLIVYGTVSVDEKQDVYFFEDVYGYDKELDAVLRKGYPYPTR